MNFVSNYPSITEEEDSSFVSTHTTLHDFNDNQITARSIPNKSCSEDQDGFLLKNESEEEGIVPYQSIYYSHAVLLKGNLKVKILSYERSASTIGANPNLYLIEVEYQHSKWILRRRYKHFQHLYNQLQLLRTSLNIPFPSKTHREQRASFKAELHKRKTKQNSIPRFPLVPEALVSLDQMELRISQLENYLNAVLENVVYRNHFETMRFLEISQFSFVDQLGVKRKEGLVKKHNGDNSSVKYNIYCREEDGQAGCCCYIICCERFGFSGFWKRRWIFVKDSFFGYFRPATNEIRCVLLMDQEFQVQTGYSETGLKYGMIVSNSCRKLVIKGLTKRETNEWIDCIQQVMNTTGSDFVQLKGENRFRSFVPARENAVCGWFVDGADFMSTVADFIENAKEEIMISDWWLSPEIYMKRPIVDGNKWRLDTILRRKAEEGVRVFVLLYKEVEMALGINSFYSKKILSQLHPNIRVLRHPDHISGTGTLLWAHHEKLVIIDQITAFVGGIDLCFGRWDDEKHRLTDLGSASWSNPSIGVLNITSSHTKGQQKPGAVFHLAKTANQVTLGTVTSEATRFDCVSKEDNTDKLEEQEENPSTTKKSRKHKIVHFHDVKSRNNVLQSNILKKTFSREVSNKNKNQNEESASNLNDANETHKECEGSSKLWVGKDYTNFIVKESDHLDEPLTDSVDRTTTPRMPWHDIGCVVSGKSARDVARHFIQRWNATKVEKAKENIDFPFLVPKSYSICDPCLKTNNLTTFASCQVLRSSSTWSVGSRITEDSIHSAYIHAIENSEHFIYIENQFFITLAIDSGVSNRVGAALYDRIVLAAERKSRFRVIVVLPLLPGFEGQIGTKSGIAMHAIMHWNYASISRGKHSLLERLRLTKIDPMEYVSFYGLRTHSQLNQQLVTELIYVHSKLMIVDDKLVICGSANINDRSLLGKRDSEIATIIEDSSFVESFMDGKPYLAGKFALSLRKRLFREHLGLLHMESGSEQDVRDPITDSFYKDTWIRIAALNTKIYEEVFRCIPCDEVTSFERLREFQSVLPLSLTDPVVAEQKLKKIQGHLVLLPLNFMNQEDLTPASGTPEALMPMSLWT